MRGCVSNAEPRNPEVIYTLWLAETSDSSRLGRPGKFSLDSGSQGISQLKLGNGMSLEESHELLAQGLEPKQQYAQTSHAHASCVFCGPVPIRPRHGLGPLAPRLPTTR